MKLVSSNEQRSPAKKSQKYQKKSQETQEISKNPLAAVSDSGIMGGE